MNWSKVKSVMIIFLILVNLSLLSYIVFEEVRTNKRNAQMADTVTELLLSKNITVDKKLVADCAKTDSAESFYVDNIVSNYEAFAKTILGELTTVAENSYKSELGSIKFKGDYFEATSSENKVLYEQKITTSNAQNVANKYLLSLGANINKADVQLTEENGTYTITYTKKINKLPVFATGLTIKMNESGIVRVSGSWYNAGSQEPSTVGLKSISGVLVEYMNKTTDKTEITDMQLGYSALNLDTYHESVFLTPVWKISDKNGGVFYIDARENN